MRHVLILYYLFRIFLLSLFFLFSFSFASSSHSLTPYTYKYLSISVLLKNCWWKKLLFLLFFFFLFFFFSFSGDFVVLLLLQQCRTNNIPCAFCVNFYWRGLLPPGSRHKIMDRWKKKRMKEKKKTKINFAERNSN